MIFKETPLKGAWLIDPKIYKDERGYFYESYSQELFNKSIGKIDFVQDNQAFSTYGVLRGLHFQNPPYSQAKLVRVVSGEVLDVIVDMREDSDTYLKHFSVVLSGINQQQLFVPRNFAHGYIVLSKDAIFQYKVDNAYMPSHENGILWNDKALNIAWNVNEKDIIVSKKDMKFPLVSEIIK